LALLFHGAHLTRGSKRPISVPAGKLGIRGRIAKGPLVLSPRDLGHLPSAKQIPDVGVYVRGASGKAVALSAIVAMARPAPGTLYVNFVDRSGLQRISHFVWEVEDLGWIAYAGVDQGTFRLLVQGLHDRRGRIDDLAWIEFSDDAFEDSEPGGLGE